MRALAPAQKLIVMWHSRPRLCKKEPAPRPSASAVKTLPPTAPCRSPLIDSLAALGMLFQTNDLLLSRSTHIQKHSQRDGDKGAQHDLDNVERFVCHVTGGDERHRD